MKTTFFKKGSVLLVLTFFWCQAIAQIPAGYYDPANGLTGDALKAALHNIIDGHTTYPYSSSSTDTWDILKEADRDPNNPNNVIGIYSGFSMNAANEYDGGNGWSREHVWAKSRGDFGTTQGAGTDAHHLRAEDVSTNSARSNRNFDYADYYYVDASGTYNGATLSKTSDTEFIWEPRDEVKGDVARMIFYMVVRYEGTNGDPDLELTDTYQASGSTAPLHAKLATLVEWHLNDPVSDAERNRNDIIYGFQQNRNPFIDHPEYVCELYPSYCGTPPANSAPTFTSTPITSVQEGQNYTYTISTNDADGDAVTITAPSIATWLTFVDNGNGSASLSGTPGTADVGSYSISLSVTDGTASNTQDFTLTVTSAGGGGGNASDLFFSEYIEGSSYNKGLEIANFTGDPVDLSIYSIQKQTNGAGSWGSELTLSGSLASSEVYVIAHSSSDAAMQSAADLITASGPMSFNGNDAIGLFKNGVLIDIIGVFNDASNFAQDVTLVRKSSISSPNTTYTVSEWDTYAADTFDYLGSHTFDGGTPPPTCDAPTGLATTNVTTTSADISWNAATGASAYNVQYRVVGAPSWTTASTASTSYSLSGLTESKNYEWQVQTDCGGSTSAFSASINFTTATTPTCDTPTSLTTTNVDTNSADLSWSAASGAASYNVQYRVVGAPSWTTASTASTSYSLSGLAESTNYEWQVQTDCGGLTSAFSASSNFTTATTPTCDTPTGLTTTNVATNSADLSWNAVSGAASYNVQYRESGAPSWTTASTAGTSYSLTGLNESTNYEWQVQADCGSLTSAFSAIQQFTTYTPASCPVTSGLTASNITTNSADLSWNAIPEAIGYGLRYRELSSGTWIYENASSNQFSLSNLTSNTTYEFEVRTECGSLNSTYTTAQTFTTLIGTITYCTSYGENGSEEWINRFSFNTINNLSGSNGGYADFTSISTSVAAGSTYVYTINPEWSGRNYNEAYDIWIDYNQNGNFDDPGEWVASVGKNRDTSISGSITIPASANNGPTRMRVSMKYNRNATSCEIFSYGEVEDYTIDINGGTNQGRSSIDSTVNSSTVESLLVFPNPVKDRLTVDWEVRSTATVKIVDIRGKQVYESQILEGREIIIDVSQFKRGTYILSIEEESSKQFARFMVN